jgi:hypothetical protein
MKIETAGEFLPRKEEGHQAGRMEADDQRQPAAAGRGPFVRPSFIGQNHHPKPHGQGTDERGEQISHHEPGEKDRQIFVKTVKHKLKQKQKLGKQKAEIQLAKHSNQK